MLGAALALPLQWLAVLFVGLGVGYVAGHENGRRQGRADERAKR